MVFCGVRMMPICHCDIQMYRKDLCLRKIEQPLLAS